MENSNVRKAVVAGQFYPATASGLKKQIEKFLDKGAKKIDALGCMLPHAGYTYSGKVAVETACHMNIRDKVILLGPNHTGHGLPFSIMTEGIWQTPLGEVAIDSALAKQLLKNVKSLEDDDLAHLYEHSLEVELPILQYFKSGFEIVPISFLSDNLTALKTIGKEIAESILSAGLKDSILLLASSDMTHYEPQAEAEKKDKAAIEAILELNEDKLAERIRELDISMCGYAPVIVMLAAAKLLGAKKAELIKYQTSGDVTGDKDAVVGYAGIIIT